MTLIAITLLLFRSPKRSRRSARSSNFVPPGNMKENKFPSNTAVTRLGKSPVSKISPTRFLLGCHRHARTKPYRGTQTSHVGSETTQTGPARPCSEIGSHEFKGYDAPFFCAIVADFGLCSVQYQIFRKFNVAIVESLRVLYETRASADYYSPYRPIARASRRPLANVGARRGAFAFPSKTTEA